jgi:hypothetical protein
MTVTQSEDQGGVKILHIYEADEPAWPMACVMQFQVCKKNTCTGFGSFEDILNRLKSDLHTPEVPFGIWQYLRSSLTLSNLIFALGKKSLASRYRTAAGLQATPEKNEWHRDVTHWFATTLAYLQFRLPEFASGPPTGNISGLEDFIIRPNATQRPYFCNSQVLPLQRLNTYNKLTLYRKSVAMLIRPSACSGCSLLLPSASLPC